MFGNRVGWILALLVLMLEGVGVFGLYLAASPTAPTEAGKKAPTYTMTFPVSFSTVVDMVDSNVNAGDIYNQALDTFRKNPKLYNDFKEGTIKPNSPIPVLPAVELLKKATHSKTADIFASAPKLLINYSSEKEPIAELLVLGKCAERLALLNKTKNNRKNARDLFEAEFSLGAKLFDERLVWKEVEAGIDLFGSAVDGMQSMAVEDKDAARIDMLTKFRDAKISFWSAYTDPPRHAIFQITPNVSDMILFSTTGGDRVWRVEASLALGRDKFYSTRQADRRAAQRYLQEILDKPEKPSNTFVRFAITTARDLTQEDARLQGN